MLSALCSIQEVSWLSKLFMGLNKCSLKWCCVCMCILCNKTELTGIFGDEVLVIHYVFWPTEAYLENPFGCKLCWNVLQDKTVCFPAFVSTRWWNNWVLWHFLSSQHTRASIYLSYHLYHMCSIEGVELELLFIQEGRPPAGVVLSSGAHLAMFGDIFSCHKLLLVCSGLRPRMLLNSPKWSGHIA